MQYQIIPVTKAQQNCTLLWCEATNQAALVDPGGEKQQLLKAMEDKGLKLEKIFLTHGHIDHVGAALDMAKSHQVPIEGPQRMDQRLINALDDQSAMFGFDRVPVFTPNRYLEQGDSVSFGKEQMQVFHCPGHTPGHVIYFHPQKKLALVGDVLFQLSIGRTDFPGGHHQTLLESIKNRLLPLGDEVTFIPGHGPCSTLGYERLNNPFLQ